MKKVLVVDDDSDLVDLLQYALRRVGYNVVTALSGEDGLQRWEAEHPDLVLLDGNLPQVDGFEVCRSIRQQARTPIILLTGRSAEEQVIDGFAAGADDYIPKPFSTKQLLARMDAVLRRYEPDPDVLTSRQLSMADFTLDPETQQVTRGGRLILLTRLEFSLLYCLVLHVGQVVPYSRLIEAGWGYYGPENSTNLLKSHVTHLRRKLGFTPTSPGGIRAELNVGYRLLKSAK
jgi:two-component system response regulator VicR